MRIPTDWDMARTHTCAPHCFVEPSSSPPPHAHEPLWSVALSRRRFVGLAAGAAGAALFSRLWLPALAQAAQMGGPKPIPGGISMPPMKETFHVFLPEPGNEPSTITDFDGLIGLSVVRGTCTRTSGSASTRFLYEVDMRFMKGRYIGTDGREATGTFGFV